MRSVRRAALTASRARLSISSEPSTAVMCAALAARASLTGTSAGPQPKSTTLERRPPTRAMTRSTNDWLEPEKSALA